MVLALADLKLGNQVAALEAVSENLPVWNGEFYLEYHRGTYTSQARNKRNNRKSEFLLHDAEFLAALAADWRPDTKFARQRSRRE